MTLFLPKINEGCQGQPRTKRLPSLTQGWKSRNRSLPPVEGEMFFLTFPFIDQAISLINRLMCTHLWEGRSSTVDVEQQPCSHRLRFPLSHFLLAIARQS